MSSQVFQTWAAANEAAKKTHGHVHCVHYGERYEWIVKPGLDPRGGDNAKRTSGIKPADKP